MGSRFTSAASSLSGNRHFSEAAVRSNFLLDEGDLLDEHLLRKSMARLNEASFFAPISERNTILHTDPKTGVADIDIRVMERKRGSWNLSGPVGPASIAGPVEASIRTRLPAWGSGLLEASTYSISLSMFAFAHSFLPVLGVPNIPLIPIVALNRPYSPGAGWKSGFMIIPAARLAVYGAGLRRVAASASLDSGIGRRSWPGAGTAGHSGYSHQPNDDALRTARATLVAGADRLGHGPALYRLDGGTLAPVNQPQHQREKRADEQARYQREIEHRVLAPDDNVSGQAPQPDRKPFAQRYENA